MRLPSLVGEQGSRKLADVPKSQLQSTAFDVFEDDEKAQENYLEDIYQIHSEAHSSHIERYALKNNNTIKLAPTKVCLVPNFFSVTNFRIPRRLPLNQHPLSQYGLTTKKTWILTTKWSIDHLLPKDYRRSRSSPSRRSSLKLRWRRSWPRDILPMKPSGKDSLSTIPMKTKRSMFKTRLYLLLFLMKASINWQFATSFFLSVLTSNPPPSS